MSLFKFRGSTFLDFSAAARGVFLSVGLKEKRDEEKEGKTQIVSKDLEKVPLFLIETVTEKKKKISDTMYIPQIQDKFLN